MQRSGPVMEGVIEENEQIFFLNNREQAQKRNAVELKQTLKFPNELLALFGVSGKPATIERVTSLHMFESSPVIASPHCSTEQYIGMKQYVYHRLYLHSSHSIVDTWYDCTTCYNCTMLIYHHMLYIYTMYKLLHTSQK